MKKKELDVFLSSDQKEFAELRSRLSAEVCNIPFLICTPLEDRGAYPLNVLDASLKAVRDCDIYVGIFGHEYSETTIREYKEAVKHKKPCFTYVKKFEERDEKLAKFIIEVLETNFKYFVFLNDEALIPRLNIDLQSFMLETLTIGLEERAKKKVETIALISKEETVVPTTLRKVNPLAEAEASFEQGKYLESLIMASATIETALRKVLQSKGISKASKQSLGTFIQVAKKSGLFSSNEIDSLRLISIYRNNAIHLGNTPDRKTIEWILVTARHWMRILPKLDLKENKKLKTKSKLWKPLPKIDFKVSQRLLRTLTFPQVGWEAYNDSPYQLRVRIEVHPILGEQDLHPLSDNNINGNSTYEVEPNSYVFANGCFTLPSVCATSMAELILEIRATVEDINDSNKGEYKFIARRWKYIRETNTWSYHPQQLKTR